MNLFSWRRLLPSIVAENEREPLSELSQRQLLGIALPHHCRQKCNRQNPCLRLSQLADDARDDAHYAALMVGSLWRSHFLSSLGRALNFEAVLLALAYRHGYHAVLQTGSTPSSPPSNQQWLV